MGSVFDTDAKHRRLCPLLHLLGAATWVLLKPGASILAGSLLKDPCNRLALPLAGFHNTLEASPEGLARAREAQRHHPLCVLRPAHACGLGACPHHPPLPPPACARVQLRREVQGGREQAAAAHHLQRA